MTVLALLGFVLGFAINHGTICTVIATRELVSERRPSRSIALVECAVWAALVYAVLETSPTMQQGWSPLVYLVPAAMSFGIAIGTNPDQAAINVSNRVQRAQALLPAEVTRQGVTVNKHGEGAR